MDRIPHRDKQPEGTAKPTGKAKKAGLRPWEAHPYKLQQLEEELNAPPSNPRLELALQNLSLHQGDFMPYEGDGDHGCGYPAFGLGATSGLYAYTSFACELGTLAGMDPLPKKPRATGEYSGEVYGHKPTDPGGHEGTVRRGRPKGTQGQGTNNTGSQTGQTTKKNSG